MPYLEMEHLETRTGATVKVVVGIVAIVVLILTASCGNGDPVRDPAAPAPVEISFATFEDPFNEAVAYAVAEGLVTSDQVSVDFRNLSIPGLIEALNAGSFDVIEAGITLVPKLVAGGVPVRVVSSGYAPVGETPYAVYVTADSTLENLGDLRGQRLAVESLGATNVFQVRALLKEKYDLDTFGDRRDVELVEVPLPQMPSLLSDGEVDAAYIYFAIDFQLENDPDFKKIASPQVEFEEHFGFPGRISARVSFADVLEEKPEAMAEFLQLFEESQNYYEENTAEVNRVIAERRDIPPAYLEWVAPRIQLWDLVSPRELISDLDRMWELAARMGEIEEAPDASELVWSP